VSLFRQTSAHGLTSLDAIDRERQTISSIQSEAQELTRADLLASRMVNLRFVLVHQRVISYYLINFDIKLTFNFFFLKEIGCGLHCGYSQ
jgi:hypothetical protein